MNKLTKRLGSMALALTMAASYTPSVFAADAVTQEPDYTGWDTIKVFETTDVHGYITDVSSYKEETFEYRLAYFSKIVNDARSNKEYEDVLLLDTGDIYQGTPHSNLTYGAAMRAAYDQMNYDAVGLGNHEFDWDVKQYAADAQGTMAPYEIGSHKGDSDIPVLMSNLYYKDSGERVEFTQDYTIVDKGKYKVGIVGWADDYSADIKASQIAPYTIDDNRSRLKELAEEVDKKADIVVILAHSDPKSIAEEMDPGVVDLVAGGHTHKNLNGTADNGIDFMQGNCYAYGYATAEIKVNPQTKDVEVTTPEFKDISPKGGDHSYLYYNNGNNAQLEPEVTKISQAAWDAVKGEMYEVLGTVNQSITRDFIDAANGTSSIAGNWLADLMLAATKDQNTVAAFANRGGIRANLEMAEGAGSRDITVADIYTISPFGNRILTFAITGQQMAQQLERALIGLNPEIEINSDAAYQASNLGDQFAGITATYKVVDGGIKVLSIMTDDGQMIDVNDTTKTYNVCVNEYCATLDGSVFKGMTPLVAMDDAPVDNLSTIAALREHRDTEGLNIELDTTVHTLTLHNKIQQLKDTLGSYDKASLTDANKKDIRHILEQVNYILSSGNVTPDEEKELQVVKEMAEALLKTTAAGTDSNSNDDGKKPTTPPKKSPKTGDTANTMPFVLLFIVGAVGAAAIEMDSRKRQNRE